MNLKLLLLLLPFALFAKEIVWDSSLNNVASKNSYEKAMTDYIEYKYPYKVEAYEQRLLNRANARDYTLLLYGIMYQDNKSSQTLIKKHKDAKAYCQKLDLAGYDDWRLPGVSQLKDALTLKFRNSVKNAYWTTNEIEDEAWVVSSLTKKSIKVQKSMRFYIRCVRSAR